ncbi:unnamed protein product [Symbiodinium natans]|uniref:Uncharacterized protein n=1 Tax=Symbiodinium natans TaxID=878477 RepID=A0A812QIJ1_9DINO|nr:unnamed protein product [Symbiodinium natans]
MASYWAADSKLHSTPGSLASFIAELTGQGPDAQGDSVNCSLAAFFICNATLHLTGESWRRCKEWAPSLTANKSPLHAAIDVVRLARIFYAARLATRNSTHCKPWPVVDLRKLDPLSRKKSGVLFALDNPAVAEIARQLPQKCERLDGLFESVTQKWFARTGAQKPRLGSKPICTVDIDAMTPTHWQLLGRLVPKCLH